jgi:hypothetical protein
MSGGLELAALRVCAALLCVLFTFVSPNSRTFLTEAQGLVCVEGDIHMILMYCICCLLRFSKLGGILWLYIGGEHHSRFQRAFDMVQ